MTRRKCCDKNTFFSMKRKSEVVVKCPVCGKHDFEEENNFEICEVCGWENDGIQFDDPNGTDCANGISLNETRKAWVEGKTIR